MKKTRKLFLCSSKIKILPGQIVKDENGFAIPIETSNFKSLNENDMYRVVGYDGDCSVKVVSVDEEADCSTHNPWCHEDTNPPVRQRITKDPDELRFIRDELREKRQPHVETKTYSALIKGNVNVIEGDRVNIIDFEGINGIVIAVLDALGVYEVIEVVQHINKPLIARLVKIQKWNKAQRGGQYPDQQDLRVSDTSWVDDFSNIKFVLEENDD